MVVLMLERASASLRGELSRWMVEPRAGVFVGRTSAMVRDKLWLHVCKGNKNGAALLIFSSQSEQGFDILSHGDGTRIMRDWEGIWLICKPRATDRVDDSSTEDGSD